jgi:hypothetical protein
MNHVKKLAVIFLENPPYSDTGTLRTTYLSNEMKKYSKEYGDMDCVFY